jgi:cytoskeletal protein CcmA (bactofilin family)
MYWTDPGNLKIQRANLDGTSVEDLITTGFNFPIGIALDVPAAAAKAFVLLAEEDIEINGQVNSDGDIHANNDIFFNEGNKPNSIHTGNVTASDDIFIKKRNKIIGTVQGDDVENKGTVTGGVTENAGIAKVPLPVLASIEPGDDDVTVKKGKTLTLDPGDYEDVKVEKKGTLNLKSGTYNLECLNLGEKAMLVIDLSSGDPIILNVDEEVIFGKNVVMILTPSTASTTLLTINCDEDDDSDKDFDDDEDDTDRVIIGEGARVFGNIIAPETMVVLDKKSLFKGAICAENILVLSGARFVHHSSTASFPKEAEVEESEVAQSEVVRDYVLEQNYPNPFSQIPRFAGNPSTKISFALPEVGAVKLQIYDLLGNLVTTLANGKYASGKYEMIWNGRNRAGELVAAGIYLYRLTVERNGEAPVVMTRKLTVLK